MSDFSQAAAELDWFAAKLKAILPVAEELRRVGSLQQAGNEAQARLDDLKNQHATAIESHKQAIAQHEGQLATVKAQIVQHAVDLADKHKAADAEIAVKKQTAADIEADARTSAASILGAARAQGAKLIADAQAAAKDIGTLITAKQAELSDLYAKEEEASAKHARITAEIAAVKARLG